MVACTAIAPGLPIYKPQVAGVLDADDLLFLRYLLVEKAGLNLRHRVAHALLGAAEYSAPLAHLLFLAVLRLGRYSIDDREVGSSG